MEYRTVYTVRCLQYLPTLRFSTVVTTYSNTVGTGIYLRYIAVPTPGYSTVLRIIYSTGIYSTLRSTYRTGTYHLGVVVYRT